MALFFDGFEQFDKAANPAAEMRLADYVVIGAIAMGDGRMTGSRGLALSRSSVSKAWPWSGNLFSCGAAVRFSARGPMMGVTGNVVVTMNPDTGRAEMLGQVGNAGPVKARWYYMELEFDRAARTVKLYFNGKLDITATMPEETAAETTLTVTLNPFDAVEADQGTRSFDDFYMTSAAHLDPVQVTTRFPTSDESPNEWAPSESPTAAHWAMVGPLPADKLDRYLIGNVSGAEEVFKSTTKLPDDSPIIGIGMVSLVRKTTVDNLTMTTRYNGRDVIQGDLPLDWKYRFSQFAVESGDNKSSVEGAKFGVVLNRN